MRGPGYDQLIAAMEYILDPEKSGQDFIQFSDSDKISIVVFNNGAQGIVTGDGNQTLEILSWVKQFSCDGGTYMHNGLLNSLAVFNGVDFSKYTVSIVNMTDGEASEDHNSQSQLENLYSSGQMSIPIYSIMFGSAKSSQLNPIATYSGGMVFDGRTSLQEAFLKVRGYN